MSVLDPRRLELVRLARACVGVPFRHQGRDPALGLDCGGLVVHIGRAVGLLDHDILDYSRTPSPEEMGRVMYREFDHVTPHSAALPGDLLWIRTGRPQHLALLTERGTVIHALSTSPFAVTEHALSPRWRRRVVAVFRFRGLD
jgi:cell wall-associated NlpC family hydrolase